MDKGITFSLPLFAVIVLKRCFVSILLLVYNYSLFLILCSRNCAFILVIIHTRPSPGGGKISRRYYRKHGIVLIIHISLLFMFMYHSYLIYSLANLSGVVVELRSCEAASEGSYPSK